ncbi:TPA: hypothetical protein ACGPOR_005077 [Pseudomonas aeruginosa]|uniref:hypothetical protein n=1 Tax=Pseudomonas aeruginosa TaxID=287 RepID=UPI003708D4EF
MTASKIQMDQIRSTSATVTGENIRAGSQKKSSLSPAEGLQGASPDATCTCPSGGGSLRHPCPAHPAVEQAGGDERDFQAEGAQEVPSPVSQEYDRHLISLLRKGEALPGHQEEAADEIERLRDWNDHLNNTVLPNILNPNFLMLMKGGERLLDLCTKDGKFIGVSLNDMKDVFDWMVTHARIAPDHAALAQPSPASDLDPLNLAPHAEAFNEAPAEALKPEPAEADRPEVVAWQYRVTAGPQTGWSLWHPGKGEEFERSYTVERRPLMTVAQHERIVGELRAVIAQLRQHKNDYMDSGQETYRALQNEIREREAEIARLDGLVSGRTAERDAALARVAELERQEPVSTEHLPMHIAYARAKREVFLGSCQEDVFRFALIDLLQEFPLYAAPVAQAQHSVPVAREQLERLVRILDAHNYAKDAEALMALLAAAPGKEVPQAWLDVQAERRRQVEAEGWTPEHDDEHACDEIAAFACFYAMPPAARDRDTSSTGYGDTLGEAILPEGWEPKTGDRRRELVKAGGLILAEIERLDRTAATQGGPRDA